MGRVAFWDAGKISREVLYLRKGVADGLYFAGAGLYLVRRAWTMTDYYDGLVERCPRCYNEVTKQVTDTRCPECYGTTFKGGYRPVQPVRIAVRGSKGETQKQDDGMVEQFDLNITMLCEPIYHTGDVFAEVIRASGRTILEVGRMFRLNNRVEAITVDGVVSNNHVETYVDWQNKLVEQRGTANLLLSTDIIAERSKEFWGVKHDWTVDRWDAPYPASMMNSSNQDGTKWQSLPEQNPEWLQK